MLKIQSLSQELQEDLRLKMKILAIGDFHGKFPSKLERRISEENPDLILSVGDFPDTTALRNLEFKYWGELKHKDSELADFVGKSRYRTLLKETLNSSLFVLKKLKSFDVPIITIYGNSETKNRDVKEYGLQGFEAQCKKLGVKLLRHGKVGFHGLDILGFSGYRGASSKGFNEVDNKTKKRLKKVNITWEKQMNKTFGLMRNPANTIFVAHDVPLGYFDVVRFKGKNPMNGKHLGDIYALNGIKKYQPAVYVCGHMHEYQGIKRIGKTRVVAIGPAYLGRAAIIELDKKNYKIGNIKFIK